VLDKTLTRLLNLPESGLLLQRVVKGSVAEKAGLRAGTIPAKIGNQTLMLGGDVIVEIDGLLCANPHDFDALKDKTALDDENTYSLRILRDGQELKLIAGAPMPTGFHVYEDDDSKISPVVTKATQ
jgi:S1-C subfamily serine protease